MKQQVFLLVALTIVGCTSITTSEETSASDSIAVIADDSITEVTNFGPKTIGDIPLPKGFERVPIEDTTSFAYFLRNLPLKPIYRYDGDTAGTTDYAYAVDAYQPSNEDITQCADAIIRLRAEWLYKNARYDEIASLSLEKDLEPTTIHAIQIGDVFIEGGSSGHAIIVVDLAKYVGDPNSGLRNDKCFLVAEGYMSQDIYILTNTTRYCEDMTPWHSMLDVYRSGDGYNFPSYTFTPRDIKRFKRSL